MSTAPVDLHNVQGDIIPGLPKKTETYLFFQISDVAIFRKQLVDIVPLIKSSAQVIADRDEIREHKRKHPNDGELLPMVGVSIAFSQFGLKKMGFSDLDGDAAFAPGQLKDASALGDPGTTDDSGNNFTPDWDPAFLKHIDGVILVAGESHKSVELELKKITHGILGPSIKEIKRITGDVRPGKNSGHEHFGFLDGISNPAVRDIDTKPLPGQEPVDKRVIFTGHDDATSGKPLLLDGSFMAFRYLLQLVPEFDDFLEKNPIVLPGLSRKDGSELLGARLVGRWKSGAPIDITPLKDDPALGKDPQRNNDFRYQDEYKNGDQSRCPYSAHTRKTNPRADLEDQNTPTDPQRIIRRGIQFGPEVTREEKHLAKTQHERGLLFVSYQSSITNGFAFIQKNWANNTGFIFGAKDPKGGDVTPGFDPIVGQKGLSPREVAGTGPNDPSGNITLPHLFVVPKGGEYFFVPSIAVLRDNIATGITIQ